MSRARGIGRTVTAAVCVMVFAIAGCAKPGGLAGSDDDLPPQPATTAPVDPNAAPTDPPAGERFTFDQAAQFDDGMLVQVSTIKSAKATAQQHGAEGTEGHMVVAEILISNNTDTPLQTDPVRVSGYYFNDVGAPKIVDTSGTLGNSFHGTLQPGEQAKATMGFAIPADAVGDVTIMIDGGTDNHGQVHFAGAVSDG